jgi:hypothetical protein
MVRVDARHVRRTTRSVGILMTTEQELRAVYENLTNVQIRCTELLLENRELKKQLAIAQDELKMILTAARAR